MFYVTSAAAGRSLSCGNCGCGCGDDVDHTGTGTSASSPTHIRGDFFSEGSWGQFFFIYSVGQKRRRTGAPALVHCSRRRQSCTDPPGPGDALTSPGRRRRRRRRTDAQDPTTPKSRLRFDRVSTRRNANGFEAYNRDCAFFHPSSLGVFVLFLESWELYAFARVSSTPCRNVRARNCQKSCRRSPIIMAKPE